ncbi:MAG TPA: ABC transporter ATP-binding protein [Bacteroidales bacterium]|nr:ABC transporter ATP-binding protein [Bacteroidales bacterium]HPF02631.1 ABC transporter ATP-binding protein [Bacteroidales bacterium]HPJ59089.1 ABC transporter ATP-binding protein [Bacteroidales bacterium]HPR11388.1 ABC transporter ATP-binding protein [Bacteroidales bacterium]HRW85661.1 ABC transporter ATP-binding protein [Bacteroidales bacterium]
MTGTPVISVKNLVKKFGSFTANDNLNFEVYEGEIFGFLGANGAGKTTALRILSGLSSPTSGEVIVAGYNALKEPEKIKKSIGYMCQKFSLYEDLTIRENIMLYGGIYGMPAGAIRKKTEELLEKLNFTEYGNRMISGLPAGLKQKLAFSVAIFHEPRIVFLDEPTGGVDPLTRRQFWEMIYETAEKGITIFVTTHYMDEAEYCDRVSIMNEGRLVALDSPAGLKQRYGAGSVEEVFIKIARPQARYGIVNNV